MEEEFLKQELLEFESLGFSKEDVDAMFSTDPKTGNPRIAEFIKNSDRDPGDWPHSPLVELRIGLSHKTDFGRLRLGFVAPVCLQQTSEYDVRTEFYAMFAFVDLGDQLPHRTAFAVVVAIREQALDVREAIRRNLTEGEQDLPEQMEHEQLQPSSLTLRVGDVEDIDSICSKLAAMGYCKSEYAFMQGQYARRGGIVDVFPYGSRLPYRIDWFDDRIDSIRTFDPDTMMSKNKCDMVVVAAKQAQQLQRVIPRKPKKQRIRNTVRRKEISQLPMAQDFSGRYYRIIIYVLSMVILLLARYLYLHG